MSGVNSKGDKETTLLELKEAVLAFVQERDWERFRRLDSSFTHVLDHFWRRLAPLEVLEDPIWVPGHPFGILGGLWWSLGRPQRALGVPWGVLEIPGVSLGGAWDVLGFP